MKVKNNPADVHFGSSSVTTKGLRAERTEHGYSAVFCEVMNDRNVSEKTEFSESDVVGEYIRFHFHSRISLKNLISALQELDRIWGTETR